jgi:hypothetical protein
MNTEISTHVWFAEQIAAYLTDGLDAEERTRFEAHAGECADCAAKLAEAKKSDVALRELFASVGPSADFEDKVIRRLRAAERPKFVLRRNIRLHPRIVRAVGVAAAAVVLGGLGYSVLTQMDRRAVPMGAASNLRQIGEANLLYAQQSLAAAAAAPAPNAFDIHNNLSFSYANPYPNTGGLGKGYRMVRGLEPTFAVSADINPGPLGKDGQNVLTTPPVASDSVLLPPDDESDGKSGVSTPVLKPAAPSPSYFRPGDGRDSNAANTPIPSSKTIDWDRELAGKPAESVPGQSPAPAEEFDAGRKIIRNGEMSFQVDSYDSAFVQISKISAEEGGFVSDTESEKLANGKMSGTVTVRVPPEHLDTLCLKLRALGDLIGQKVTAQDITKEYTDLESELRAAKAMEDRLVEIIKTGNGQVKDLVAAEREVGVWREKVEKVTGEINYYNNLVALSTLQITLEERDIRRAAVASEHETVDIGIETPDVEKARDEAMSALDAAKARTIQADLKKLDAGQFAATIVADLPADSAGPVVDHLKQLGHVARLNMNRQQTVADGATVPPGVKIERLDTRLQISLYNLANISPRQTTNVAMACGDVESAYHAILAQITGAGGRVVDSSLNRIKPDQTDAAITFETPVEKADSVLAAVRMLGQVMQLTVAENPDTANVTAAKQGFAITLASEASVLPRETITTTLMPAGNLADAYHALLAIVQKNHGQISVAQLQEQNSQSNSANLFFDISRDAQGEIEKTIAGAVGSSGRVISRQNSRSNDTEHTLDTKVGFNITFASFDTLQPREIVSRVLAAQDVNDAYSRILAAAQQIGAGIVAASEDQSNPSNPSGQLDLIVWRTKLDGIEKTVADTKAGTFSRSVARSTDWTTTTDDKVELKLTIGDIRQVPPRETTTMALEAADPEAASSNLQAAVLAAGGQIVEQHLIKDDKYQAHLVVEVPLAKGSDFIDQVRDAGTVQTVERTEDPNVPDADFVQAKLDITLDSPGAIVGPGAGLWAGLKSGLTTSIRGLAYSIELIVIGLCLALPWAVLGWVGWKAVRRLRKKTSLVVSPQAGPS